MSRVLVKLERISQEYPAILTPPEKVRESKGFSLESLEAWGLTKSDLIRLERMGRAVRGYTPNIFPPNEKDGEAAWLNVEVTYKDHYVDARGYDRHTKRTEVERRPRFWYRGKGMRVRWVLIAEVANASVL
jgi:hypothetical protein